MQARRQQRERILGIVLAILGVGVLVVAVVALTRPDSGKDTATAGSASSSAATTSPRATPRPTSSASPSTTSETSEPGASLSLGDSSSGSGSAKKVPLIVLNNTRTNGLATDAADDFRDGGWKVDRVGNLSNNIISTCAYYDPDEDGAEQAAKALRKQFPGIDRVEERFAELPSGPIVVVLTSGYSSN